MDQRSRISGHKIGLVVISERLKDIDHECETSETSLRSEGIESQLGGSLCLCGVRMKGWQ